MMSSKQQNRGGGDQIKKFKKEKSMKEADPDGLKKAPIQSSYMGLSQTQQRKPSPSKVTNELPNYKKPTSRFDASKDKLQVSTDSSTSSTKIKSMNNSQNTNSSKPVSSSDCPGSKTVAKDLVRNLSLKPVRYSMKKNSGVGLHPTVNLSRATYSSTVKITRNPESLDLDVSNMKLCSYTYCSLHGQKHEVSLPRYRFLARIGFLFIWIGISPAGQQSTHFFLTSLALDSSSFLISTLGLLNTANKIRFLVGQQNTLPVLTLDRWTQ